MAVKLRDLVSKIENIEMKLVAGRAGLDNVVRWVHMVENAEISDFLEGGEIAFTTGIGLGNNLTLLSLVQNVYKNKASAMVINIGPFVKEIDSEIIEFANRHDFPIFQVPWKEHMAQIMRIFCFEITESERRSMETAVAIKNAILCHNQPELYVMQLQEKGFLKEWNYCIVIVDIDENCNRNSNNSKITDKLKNCIEGFWVYSYKNTSVIEIDGKIVILMANYTQEEIRKILNELTLSLKKISDNMKNIYFAAGSILKDAVNIYRSYNQALKLSLICRAKSEEGNISFYHDMGIYKLLFAIEDKAVILDYYNETIEPLARYDKINGMQLCDVLKCYLKNSGSVQDTAKELFIHRNTVNYKINKIEEILNLDLSKLEVRLKLNIGFMLADVMDNML